MKIGIGSDAYLDRYGLTEGLKRMRAHGYQALDYQSLINTDNVLYSLSDNDFENALVEVKDACKASSIEITQAHGPWRWPPRDYTAEDRVERFVKMSKALHGTRMLGCPYMVIHPIMPFGDDANPEPERFMELNLDYYTRLTKVAERENVVICLENMPMPALTLARPAEILAFVKTIDSDYMKVCLDTGHCTVCDTTPADAVRMLGKDYLKVLHVHDNNGKMDLHWLPYKGVIDWADFSDALTEVGFEGSVSLETKVDTKIPNDLVEPFEIGVVAMAKQIAKQI